LQNFKCDEDDVNRKLDRKMTRDAGLKGLRRYGVAQFWVLGDKIITCRMHDTDDNAST
jgi:hypothetical protein